MIMKIICLPAFALAQGIPIKDGTTSTLATVNSRGVLQTNEGPSSRVTYFVTPGTPAGGLAVGAISATIITEQ
jgi:hypothetical protein